MWKHWVVRSSTPEKPFGNFEIARSTWLALSRNFPDKVAAILMPNHLHILLRKEVTDFPFIISGILGGISRRMGKKKLWQPMREPSEVPDRFHLKRQVRYIALNPCRRELCTDPLEWYWSTYREVMGASPAEQASDVKLSAVLGMPPKDFRVRFHAYVSGDPSVRVSGTPAPIPASPEAYARFSIAEILTASAATLLAPLSEVEGQTHLRHFFIHFAWRHGWRQTSLLAEICKISRQAVYSIRHVPPPAALECGDLCLGDPRLRRPELLKK